MSKAYDRRQEQRAQRAFQKPHPANGYKAKSLITKRKAISYVEIATAYNLATQVNTAAHTQLYNQLFGAYIEGTFLYPPEEPKIIRIPEKPRHLTKKQRLKEKRIARRLENALHETKHDMIEQLFQPRD